MAAGKTPRRRRSYHRRPEHKEHTMNTTIIDPCDVAAYRSWTNHRVAPAYLRGIPSWVWQAALCRRQQRRQAAAVT
jgi:hypothetical protein